MVVGSYLLENGGCCWRSWVRLAGIVSKLDIIKSCGNLTLASVRIFTSRDRVPLVGQGLCGGMKGVIPLARTVLRICCTLDCASRYFAVTRAGESLGKGCKSSGVWAISGGLGIFTTCTNTTWLRRLDFKKYTIPRMPSRF